MLKLQPDPTFRAKVGIPVPGGATTEIEVECKHLTKDVLEPKLKELTDDQFAAEVVVGWSGVDEAFSAEGLAFLLNRYSGAAREIVLAYLRELTGARSGN